MPPSGGRRRPLDPATVTAPGGVVAGRPGEARSYAVSQADLTRWQAVFLGQDSVFAPNYPLAPPQPEPVRTWDFQVGRNAIFTPRAYEPISFEQLRALAANHDITRLAIETRKDQIEKLKWSIQSIDKKHPKQDAQSRIDSLTALWQKPDGERPFGTWLRAALEDLLVIDAPAFEVRRSRDRTVIGLDVIDGQTILPLIDYTGRVPQAPAPAYEQVIHGRPWRLLSTDDLIYAPRNRRPYKIYGFSPCEQIIMTINTGLRRQLMQLQYFTEGNVPAGFVSSPDTWNPEQIKQFQEWVDSILAGNTGARTRLIWGPAGSKYEKFQDAPYKDLFDEWVARIVCYAFSLPPTPFIDRAPNRSSSETLQEAALEEGLAPLTLWVKRLVDSVIQDRMGHTDLHFTWDVEEPMEPEDQAKVIDVYVKNGVYTHNEARGILGLDPVDGGDQAMILSASGPILLSDVAAISAQAAAPPAPPPAPHAEGEEEAGEAGPDGKKTPPRQEPGNSGGPEGKPPAKSGNSRQNPSKSAAAGKLPKASVGFEHPAKGPNHCSECTHFEAPDQCRLVAGEIEPGDWCEKFQAKPKTAAALAQWLKGTRNLDPEFARPVTLPIADEATRADVEHIAWHAERKLRLDGGGDFPTRTVPIGSLVATQPDVDQSHVDRKAEELASGEPVDPPITVFLDGRYYIIDGHHRVEAAKQIGAPQITVCYIVDTHDGHAEVAKSGAVPFRGRKVPRDAALMSAATESITRRLGAFFATRAGHVARQLAPHIGKGLALDGNAHTDSNANRWGGSLSMVHPNPEGMLRDSIAKTPGPDDARPIEPITEDERQRQLKAKAEELLAAADLGDWDEAEDILAEEIGPVYADGMWLGLAAVADALGQPVDSEVRFGISLDQVNERALAWAKQHAAAQVTGINDRTRGMIRNAVAEAIDSGEGAVALGKRLQLSPGFSAQRSGLIGRSEVVESSNAGNLQAYQENSDVVTGKEWLTSGNATVCQLCLDNEAAGPITLDDTFPSGDDAPTAHPDCCPGDTLVLADDIQAATKRWYDGDLLVIRTAGGNELRCTPNHPILTPAGWVAACLLNKGGAVISSRLAKRMPRDLDLDNQDVPARIEDIAEAFGRSEQVSAVPVPTASEDFHGDGIGSEVAIVWADRMLRHGADTSVGEHIPQLDLALVDVVADSHVGSGSQDPFCDRVPSTAGRHVRGSDLGRSVLGSHSAPFEGLGFGLIAAVDITLNQYSLDGVALHTKPGSDRLLGEAALVQPDRLDLIEDNSAPASLDAANAQPSGNMSDRYPGLSRYLGEGFAGEVFLDAVVDVSRVVFADHVYNLQTVSGWYVAGGIIAHNCDCVVLPYTGEL